MAGRPSKSFRWQGGVRSSAVLPMRGAPYTSSNTVGKISPFLGSFDVTRVYPETESKKLAGLEGTVLGADEAGGLRHVQLDLNGEVAVVYVEFCRPAPR